MSPHHPPSSSRPNYVPVNIADPQWPKRMKNAGKTLANHNVKQIVFVHGTFAGDDPLGIHQFIDTATSHIPSLFLRLSIKNIPQNNLRTYTKKLTNNLLKDLGNFSPSYIKTFSEGLDQDILPSSLIWSGRNNHIARLKGAVLLANLLSQSPFKKNRVLLIGHSHAGQIFALLTILLEQGQKAQPLLNIIKKIPDTAKLDIKNFSKTLKKLETLKLDIVTYGTPARYHWGNFHKQGETQPFYQLLSVINARNDRIDITGVISARDGDYVQHFALNQTDLPVINHKETSLNKELNSFIVDRNISFRNKQRHFPHAPNAPFSFRGEIDYKDNGAPFLTSIFGHATYTKKEAMLFNMEYIISQLYSV